MSTSQPTVDRSWARGLAEVGLGPLALFVCLAGSAAAFQRACVAYGAAGLCLFVLVSTHLLPVADPSRPSGRRGAVVGTLALVILLGVTMVDYGFVPRGGAEAAVSIVGPLLTFLLPVLDRWAQPRTRLVGALLAPLLVSRVIVYLEAEGPWWLKVILLPAEVAFAVERWSGSATLLMRGMALAGAAGAAFIVRSAWIDVEPCLGSGDWRGGSTHYYMLASTYLFQAITVLRAPASGAVGIRGNAPSPAGGDA